jgi:hypothetical protein
VEHPGFGLVCASGDHHVYRWETVVTDQSQLTLSSKCMLFDSRCNPYARQQIQVVYFGSMVVSRSSGVARLEQKGQAGSELPPLDPRRDRRGTLATQDS